ncbi:hypothetical protein Zmor_002081 [Zophobas morio]|uniref:Uncharacterized protein n=1 Tax=Zophobas morio TaxID=2755281 RepID=A0AA38J441_9CUCU|nr:hypothetical protein Zmor_002081 [Zophobas morio]
MRFSKLGFLFFARRQNGGTYVWRLQDVLDGAQEARATIAEELGSLRVPMSHGVGRRRPEPSKRHTWSIHGHHSIYGSCIVAKYWLLGLDGIEEQKNIESARAIVFCCGSFREE